MSPGLIFCFHGLRLWIVEMEFNHLSLTLHLFDLRLRFPERVHSAYWETLWSSVSLLFLSMELYENEIKWMSGWETKSAGLFKFEKRENSKINQNSLISDTNFWSEIRSWDRRVSNLLHYSSEFSGQKFCNCFKLGKIKIKYLTTSSSFAKGKTKTELWRSSWLWNRLFNVCLLLTNLMV